MNYKPVILRCIAFRFCVFRVMLLGSRGPPVEKKGEKVPQLWLLQPFLVISS